MTYAVAVFRILESKLAEAKSKKDTLKARAKSAEASRQITDMIQGLNTSNALTAFEKMEEKVMALESESEATLQVRPALICRARVLLWAFTAVFCQPLFLRAVGGARQHRGQVRGAGGRLRG